MQLKARCVKVLISTSTFGEYNPAPVDKLKANGFELVLNPFGRRLKTEESVTLLQGVQGLIAGTENLTADVLSQAQDLRVISRCGTGLDNIDIETAQRLGIKVLSTTEAPVQAVAELTLGLILALIRRIVEADRQVRIGRWKPLMGSLLTGKTLGVVGLGRIGKRLAQLASVLGLRVLADEAVPDLTFVRKYGVQLQPLNSLLSQSDIISLHVPLTDQTRHLIDRDAINLMKPNTLLINTSRGAVIDEGALFEALEADRLGGAALDVYSEEPYRGPLQSCDKIILTAHMGSYAREARIQMEMEAVENLICALKVL